MKIVVNLTEESLERVNNRSLSSGKNKAIIVNKAIAIESFISEAQESGKKFLIKDKDGSIREVTFG